MAAVPSSFPLADAEEREYQKAIARACQGRNSLVVLPTGLGKTVIAALVIARHVQRGGRVLVLAPTCPLVDQHLDGYQQQLPWSSHRKVTGETRPENREEAWDGEDIVIATPQTARNDLGTRLDPGDWDLIIVDEAHRAVGGHASVAVAKALQREGACTLALTASPGNTPEAIQEVIENLGIEHVEARDEQDADVAPYVDPVSIEWIRVNLPNTLEEAADELRRIAKHHVQQLRSLGVYDSRFVKRGELLSLRERLASPPGKTDPGTADAARKHTAQALRVLHAINLVETQSTQAARSYLASLEDSPIADHPAFTQACHRLDSYMGEHPKMKRTATCLKTRLEEDPASSGLVFAQTRDTARALARSLDQSLALNVDVFVGSSGSDGLSKDEQQRRIKALGEGELDVLVATSVGEEGLDLPDVDLVVFYEPVASGVRTVQRRGRTGRDGPGEVVVLITRGTSDEATYWTAAKREKRMRRLIRHLRSHQGKGPEPEVRGNPSAVEEDEPDELKVLVDHKDANGPLARGLRDEGITVDAAHVPHGDVVVSDRVVLACKTVPETRQDLEEGTLERDVRAMKRGFETPVLLLRGDLSHRGGSGENLPRAIGPLTTQWGISILTTSDPRDQVRLAAEIIQQEHAENRSPSSDEGSGGRSLGSQQAFLLQALPNVSSKLCRKLLATFGTPAAVFEASEEELEDVPGIGPNTATAIHRVLHEEAETSWRNGTSVSTPAPGTRTRSGTGARRSASSRSPATTP